MFHDERVVSEARSPPVEAPSVRLELDPARCAAGHERAKPEITMDLEVFRVHADVEQRHWWFIARRSILRAVLQSVLPADGTRKIVDMGCGVGATASAFRPSYRWAGYDPSAEAIALAHAAHPGVRFQVGSAAEAAIDLRDADAALLTDVIEHVEDDRALLWDVIRPIREGAYILVTVPAGMELWSPHDVALGHYRRYDRHSFAAVWAGMPVEPVLVTHFNSRLYVPVRIARMLTSRFDRSAGAAGTDFDIPLAPLNALLERIFAGEARHIVMAARTGDIAYANGVSLLALLRRTGSTN
jgi:SAM-dependent methyltransferase